MKKHLFGLSLTLGAVVLGVAYVAKKTGFFENDSHLYDEFESR
ncbi:methanol dehydrogenase [Lapidilactobacillus mulanensis]|uniref:Methanol dehydrogenase n=1 Tax=Lapidilactobacillus mulanensis TaxID=2485999 RepID=A0ABW4DQM1_9LACO|nr:methanol dehydrogenase [Lapidilactobacillus mulanensis]